jgi:hypothetical protein
MSERALQVVGVLKTLDVGISVDGLEEHPEAFPAIQLAAFLDTGNVAAFEDSHFAEDTRTWRRWDRDQGDHDPS